MLASWAPLVIWLITIFFFSTDNFSSGETSRIIVPFLKFFFPGLSPLQIDFWHIVIRKLGHISEYFVLTLLAYRALKRHYANLFDPVLRTSLLVLMAALLDEFHQSFTRSRGASIVDVGYDCLGAVWALCLVTTYETRRLRSHPIL